MYRELLGYMTEDAASVYVQDPSNICAVNRRLTGYAIYPMYIQDMSTVRLASAN
jgi:peptide/nickel transport system substrate-binding protein